MGKRSALLRKTRTSLVFAHGPPKQGRPSSRPCAATSTGKVVGWIRRLRGAKMRERRAPVWSTSRRSVVAIGALVVLGGGHRAESGSLREASVAATAGKPPAASGQGLARVPGGDAESVVAGIPDNDLDPHRFQCRLSETQIDLGPDGRGTWVVASGATLAVRVRVDSGFIERIWCASVDEDVVLVLGLSDGEGDWGRVVRLSARSGKEQWSRRILKLNLGEPLLVDAQIYVAARGYVAKLNLRTGAVLWRHEGLERPPTIYDDFEKPQIKGNRVTFCERLVAKKRTEGPHCLVVEATSGAIVTDGPSSAQ
jgi:PQQ-like domain